MKVLVLVFLVMGQWLSSGGQQLICDSRNPEGHSGVKQTGDGTFEIEVIGRHAENGFYEPNEVYTVRIKGLSTRYSVKRFLEFLLVVESEKQIMMGDSGLVTTGIFHVVDESLARYSDFCPDGVTNINHRPKTEITVLWTAPSILVASCVTFKATVVERPHVWYMDDGRLTKTLCPFIPAPPSTTSTTLPPPIVRQESERLRDNTIKCCACDEAKYEVAFQGIWSKETHPKDFPENKWLLHFSDIIGASHDAQFYFWEVGKLASEGVRHVAEWGATRILENELRNNNRNVNTIIKARGLWYPNERGQTTAAFRVDQQRHLMSLVTMIGPSPDWFVGLSGYDLCTSDCSWLEEASFDLYPYDAGTDNGLTYMAPNDRTFPAQLIRRISETNDSRSPFYDTSGEAMKPFAQLHLRRQQIYPRSCSTMLLQEERHEITISENSEDVGRPECAVSEWSPWSDCSVTCDKGLRMRKRFYLMPPKEGLTCDRQLEEKEMCLGVVPICDNDELRAGGNEDYYEGICAVTRWSPWTPCDRPCGQAKRTRSRRYRDHMGRKRCSVELTQTEQCMGEFQGCNQNAYANSGEIGTDPECPVTAWSEYSPCSTTCGKGFRERTRFFLISPNSPVPTQCLRVELTQNASCTGEYGSCDIDMAQAKEICMLEPEVGPCRFWSDQLYFSLEKGMCVPFRYGGCKGNRNRFDSEMQCLKVCGFLNGKDVTLNEHEIRNQSSVPPTERTIIPTLHPTEQTPPADKFETFDVDLNLEAEAADEPVDCVVSKYSDWSICHGECGEIGYTTRSREIIIEPRDGKYKPAQKCPQQLTKHRECRVQC